MTTARQQTGPCDVLVVGAGPTGLVLANELARHGVKSRIIDKAVGPSRQSKALVIQVRTLEIFEQMGLIAPVLNEGQRIHAANFYMDGKRRAKITFASLDSPYPYPVMLPQNRTEEILIEALHQKNVTVERETELLGLEQAADSVTARIRNRQGVIEEVQVPWLVGCDGARSQVRHSLALPFEGSEYQQTFVLADVHVDWDLPADQLHLFFKKSGFLASFPMKEAGRIRLMGVRQNSGGPEQADPDLAEMQSLMDAFGPGANQLHDPNWLAKFTLHHRGVSRYQVGRVFVAGDAAHIHSPVGGQGMNTGIQDAYNLGWKLGLVIRHKLAADLLETYQAERQPVGHKVLSTTDRMFEAMLSNNMLIQFFRNHVLPHVLPFIADFAGRLIAHTISELDVNYRRSPIVSESGHGCNGRLPAGPRPGERAPDVTFAGNGSGGGRRLFEMLQIPQHALLLFQGSQRQTETNPGAGLKPLLETDYADLIRPFYVSCGDGAVGLGNAHQLADADLAAHKKYGAENEGAVYLIRPDSYVAYRSRGLNAGGLKQFLAGYFKR